MWRLGVRHLFSYRFAVSRFVARGRSRVAEAVFLAGVSLATQGSLTRAAVFLLAS